MKTFNTYYTSSSNLKEFIDLNHIENSDSLLIQIFTSNNDKEFILDLFNQLNLYLPKSKVIGSTTDGEIKDGLVSTKQTVISFSLFENTTLSTYIEDNIIDFYQAGVNLASKLIINNTKVIISFIDGLNGNGEEFLNGIAKIDKNIKIAGGLSGDNGTFTKTYVFVNNTICSCGVVGVALNSNNLNIHTQHSFDWLPIGKKLRITKAIKNRVYTIDNKTAYETYAYYLGKDIAEQLPAVGIEFPLILQKGDLKIARAVLSNEEDGSLIFAGNIKTGDIVRFGYGDSESILSCQEKNIDKIIDKPVESIFIYSCMARRRFMPNEIEMETKPFQQIANTAGFFTYGEFYSEKNKELLNQTMTILALSESNTIQPKNINNVKRSNKVNSTIKALSHLIAISSNEIDEQKEKFDYLFRQTIEAKALYQDNKCIAANDACVKLFGFESQDDTIGVKAIDFIADDSVELVYENIKNNITKPYEVNAKKKDGSTFPALVVTQHKIFDEKLTRITSVIDLTELKEKEKALELATQKAQNANRSKSQFLANMSHEIRTPMNGILGMVQLIMQTNLTPKQKHYLENINSSSENLLNIINDILDFSKIEAGKLEISYINFNFKSLLKNVFNIIHLKADEKGLDFKITYNNSITNLFGDSLRITQILINLINNAIKFTTKGFVKVNIVNINNIYRFEIEDSGIGISKDELAKLFQSFSQADGSITRKYGGTGLGLSISKQLVELMGGKIWVESEVGVGSKFIFEIELEKGDQKDIKNLNLSLIDTNQINTLNNSNILLVEDNLINQEIIIGLLANSGINIDIANNGQESIEKFKQNKYNLILMDLQMPIMGGIEATEIIRAIDKDIPIIALTANAMKEDIEQTKKAGMQEHLNKPIDVDNLYETLLKYIEINRDKVVEEDNLLPNFKVLDDKVGLQHMANNIKLYKKILNDFYVNYKDIKLEVLDDDELKIVAHTIKGLSANIGASNLSKISEMIEKSLDKGLFQSFYEELKIVFDDLMLLNNNSLSIDKELFRDDKKVLEIFNSVKEFAAKRRTKQCKELLDDLLKYHLSDKDKILLNSIKVSLNKRNYMNIIKAIDDK